MFCLKKKKTEPEQQLITHLDWEEIKSNMLNKRNQNLHIHARRTETFGEYSATRTPLNQNKSKLTSF